MKRLLIFAALLFAASAVPAQDYHIKLWDNATAPTSNGLTGEELSPKPGVATNTQSAEIWIYKADPEKATGQAIVFCPGGGYSQLSVGNGHTTCKWLAENGITAVALKYRVPNGHSEVPLEDVRAALKWLRDHAREYGADPAKVGIFGFSAGGHLAASASTLLPDAERPAFAVLVYPVITAEAGKCHKGSFDELLGKGRTAEEEVQWSLQNRVTEHTPTTLLLLADDDRTVPPVNSTLYYEALKRNGVKASLHIYPNGGHGGGFNPKRAYRQAWRADVLDWLSTLPEE